MEANCYIPFSALNFIPASLRKQIKVPGGGNLLWIICGLCALSNAKGISILSGNFHIVIPTFKVHYIVLSTVSIFYKAQNVNAKNKGDIMALLSGVLIVPENLILVVK